MVSYGRILASRELATIWRMNTMAPLLGTTRILNNICRRYSKAACHTTQQYQEMSSGKRAALSKVLYYGRRSMWMTTALRLESPRASQTEVTILGCCSLVERIFMRFSRQTHKKPSAILMSAILMIQEPNMRWFCRWMTSKMSSSP
jgi:hypothetical protein